MNSLLKKACAFIMVVSIFLVGMAKPASAVNIMPKGSRKIVKAVVKKSPKIASTAVRYAPKAVKIVGTASQVGVIVNATSSAYDLYEIKKSYDNHRKDKNKNNWF